MELAHCQKIQTAAEAQKQEVKRKELELKMEELMKNGAAEPPKKKFKSKAKATKSKGRVGKTA